MVSLRLISAMVLAYCTIVTANPASDAWFTKEINELMEAKEQMDELINDGEPMTEEYEGEEMTEEYEAETPWIEEEIAKYAVKEGHCLFNKDDDDDDDECDYTIYIDIIKRVRKSLQDLLLKIVIPDPPEPRKPKTSGELGTTGNPAASCKSIKNKRPSAESGKYWIRTKVEVHCEMGDNVCGGSSAGWMRIGNLDTNSKDNKCPYPLINSNRDRFCEAKNIGELGGCTPDTTFYYVHQNRRQNQRIPGR